MYCRTARGCMSAIEPENSDFCACVLSPEGSVLERRFASKARQPSAHSSSIRSNHMVSCVMFWMWTSRNTLSRSSGCRRAEGDFAVWILVLTDNGLVTCSIRRTIYTWTYRSRMRTHRKLVEFPKTLQTRVVRPLHRSWCIRISRGKPIRDRTCQHVLTELLHLMMRDVLKPVPRRERTCRSAKFTQE